jgi:hypothetical protein
MDSTTTNFPVISFPVQSLTIRLDPILTQKLRPIEMHGPISTREISHGHCHGETKPEIVSPSTTTHKDVAQDTGAALRSCSMTTTTTAFFFLFWLTDRDH